MDHPYLLSSSAPRFPPRSHMRSVSRSPTRPRVTDDILVDLSPVTTFEAFTSASGTLKASIEAASPTQREFGIRAALASKKIHEWAAELAAWPWPMDGSDGFRSPITKRRKLSHETADGSSNERLLDQSSLKEEYWGSLSTHELASYERRIDEISEDMEELDVEAIKSQILDTHVLPRTRPTSSHDLQSVPPSFLSYTRMDDFTAVVTATVLQALPALSHLTRLMDVWNVRLAILRQVPLLMLAMDDAKRALQSAWTAIDGASAEVRDWKAALILSQNDYEIMRDVLQDKVTILGHRLDQMLDTLEGRQDTLPEEWLDRMEAIEQDYGEWSVHAERRVREDAWVMREKRQAEAAHPISKADKTALVPSDENKGGASLAESSSSPSTHTEELNSQRSSETARENSTSIPEGSVQSNDNNSIIASLPSSDFPSWDGINDPVSSLTASSDRSQAEGGLDSIMASARTIFNPPKQASVMAEELSSSTILSTPSMRQEVVTDHSSDDACLSIDPEPNRPAISLLKPKNIEGEEPIADKPEMKSLRTQDHEPNSSILAGRTLPNTMSLQHHAPTPPIPLELSSADTRVSSSDDSKYIPSHDDSSSSLKVPENVIVHTATASQPSTAAEILTAPGMSGNKEIANVYTTVDYPMTNEALPIQASSETSAALESPVRIEATRAEVSPLTENPAKDLEDTKHSTVNSVVPKIPAKSESRRTADRGHFASLDAISSSDVPGPEVEDFASTSISRKPARLDLQLPLPSPTDTSIQPAGHLSPDDHPSKTKGHARGPSTASAISGYASSEPSPEIKEAEPTEYFRPVSPPIMGKMERPETPDILTPTRATFIPLESPPRRSSVAAKEIGTSPSPPPSRVVRHSWTPRSMKGEEIGRERSDSTASEPKSTESTFSPVSIGFPHIVTQTERQRQLSMSSDSPSISEILLESSIITPVKASPSNSETAYGIPSTDKKSLLSLTGYDEESPSLGRVRMYGDLDRYDTPDSPLPDLYVSKRRPSELSTSASFDSDSLYPESPMTPAEAPVLSNVDVSPIRELSYPSKASDDLLQQQISEILESIPTTKIRLVSELDSSKPSGIPKLKKRPSRPSLNPASRPASRAPSPSFTLAPVFAKNPRPRPQNGNPEIKLYHLSRSTGEAPIKLFVRLVGEHGERVMVRVGGGWADLGEYLKEYASHHGRRSDKEGKVEIQDLPPRTVSMGSNVSTIRNGVGSVTGNSSPVSRPASSLERPLSSLAVHKTRKSVGEEARTYGHRSPSTPLPHSFRSSPSVPRLPFETPPSARSISRSEWTEEDSSLGLAGPKGRKVDISEKDAAWVESMKEKVRLASAEKEKKAVEAAFGEMEKVGGTKRLFKKNVS